MNEHDLRALVREAIARHANGNPAWPPSLRAADTSAAAIRRHPSHELFVIPSGAEGEGPCIIEPTVSCHHCGYCQSYGH